MSANSSSYALTVTPLTISGAAVTRYTAIPCQMGVAIQWISGATFCFFGGLSLTSGGSFGMVIPPSSATGTVAPFIELQAHRGDVYLGAGSTAVVNILSYQSALGTGAF